MRRTLAVATGGAKRAPGGEPASLAPNGGYSFTRSILAPSFVSFWSIAS